METKNANMKKRRYEDLALFSRIMGGLPDWQDIRYMTLMVKNGDRVVIRNKNGIEALMAGAKWAAVSMLEDAAKEARDAAEEAFATAEAQRLAAKTMRGIQ